MGETGSPWGWRYGVVNLSSVPFVEGRPKKRFWILSASRLAHYPNVDGYTPNRRLSAITQTDGARAA